MLFLSTITFILLFFFLTVCHRKPTQKSPPSPLRLPIVGNLHQLGSLPHRSLQALSNRYGSIMLLRIGCVPTIIVSSEEMAREVMKKNDLGSASRPKSSMAKMLIYDRDMAFAPYGEYWRQVRKISVIHLLSFKMVQTFFSIREEEVSIMIDKIRASQHALVDLSELFVSLSSDIICRVALGRKYIEGVGAKKVRDMLGELGYLLGSFPIGDFIPWLGWVDNLTSLNSRARKNSKELDSFLEEVLQEHLQARRDVNGNYKEDGDFVDILLSLDEKDERIGVSLEKDEKVGVSLSLGRDSIKAIILVSKDSFNKTLFTILI
ncbi:uncharacterized protein A4U43_C06F5840 [Asparagus officinalis]|uniref:Cytochrome P450 n=1 Tax=Asparagus officinalis TaxID=4686 RepID=A0A5P1EM48_ASPOF|nr:uncharacterized protein A4U43_C06F5840 [Asparagus officinalis]